ncbi:hypothetical protein LIPSTDRAFT_75641 [Lipomyces starkeyi NRRL Y-11557]|uniref:Uncharacterized protein n=1 Tax=Lipomyces starkeyi NRRL Y-11557 TaxID=675824 RepID=A0A1E3PVH0_LIPST|nr:hypothetical protein LIPSTDRAFT_75641 [Lipomyces starkeyi NRRL Y-11557]
MIGWERASAHSSRWGEGIALVTHDECWFNSNDDANYQWIEDGETVLKKKGQGQGLMVSDLFCACHGPIRFGDDETRKIMLPGKNREGRWRSENMIVSYREKQHPNCIGLFLLAQS